MVLTFLDFCLFVYFSYSFQSCESQKPENLGGLGLANWQVPDWLQSDGRLLAEKLLCTLEPSLKSTILHRGWGCHGLLASPDHVSQSYAWEVWRNLILDLHVAACAVNPSIFNFSPLSAPRFQPKWKPTPPVQATWSLCCPCKPQPPCSVRPVFLMDTVCKTGC